MTDKLFILGDTSFERMRTRGAYFVDKTAYIRQIYEDGNYCLVSKIRLVNHRPPFNTLYSRVGGGMSLCHGSPNS